MLVSSRKRRAFTAGPIYVHYAIYSMTNYNRCRSMFNAWYQPNVHMTREEYMYIGVCLLSWVLAFNLGLLLGWLWTLAI